MNRLMKAPARIAPWLAGLGLVVGLSMPAHAGLFDDEEARKAILDIRARLDRADAQSQQALQAQQQQHAQLQQQLADRKAELADLMEQVSVLRRANLELNNQLELLRADQARLRGQDEQATQTTRDVARDLAEFQRKQKDLVAVLAALDDRIKRFEPTKVTLDGREVVVDPAEKKAYDDAIAVLRRTEYAKAVEALQAFNRRYTGSVYAVHVQYWLGNALYGKGDTREAAATFRALVTAAPDHPRAPESLLLLANCQVELKDSKAARKTLEELIKGYPQSDAAQAGRERLTQIK
jgi:tol-pal system protein YbgF